MYPRILNLARDKSFFLFGPRGTGKSTWIQRQLQPALVIDLLHAPTWQRLLAQPADLEKLVAAAPPGVVVIDEVQRAPDLLHEVHRLIEARGTVFGLTGSSARKLRRGGANLLAGRALTYHMHPLTAAELGGDFDLTWALRHGGLPGARQGADPEAFLSSYVETYLREEVMQEGLTRNLAAFARFLRAVAFSHGGQLNVAEVARECAVERKTVAGYLEVLHDLLLARTLDPFTRRAKRRLVQHGKFYFFDAGVFRALRPKGPLDRPAEIDGAALEGLVLQELIATNDLYRLGYEVQFWRTATGHEVDFVLYGPRGLHAIEVKHTGVVRQGDLAGLRAFMADYPEASGTLLYLGERAEQHGDIAVRPVGEVLAGLGGWLGGQEVRGPDTLAQ